MGSLTPGSDDAPGTYGELYEQYWDYTQALVARFGIADVDTEDVASEILLKFYERGFLEKFEKDALFETPRGRRRSSFRGFLSGFVSLYVRQAKDRQMTRQIKEPIRLQQPVGDASVWIEVYGPAYMQEHEHVDFPEQARRALDYLRSLPVKGQRDLARLFEMLVEQVVVEGHSNRREIARAFKVSDTAVCLWMQELRAELRTVGFAPGVV